MTGSSLLRSTLSIRLVVRRLGVCSIAMALACHTALTSVPQKAESSRKPNIIFILADDLGYGDLGCYGQKRIRTSNIDRMAGEGVRFTQCYAGSTVCAPSRASLMTGLHQGHAHIRGNNPRLPLRAADLTVAEILRSEGYRTGIVGKWGLGEPDTVGIPNRRGFDYFFGYLNQTHAHNYYPDHLWRNRERVSVASGTYSHDLFTDEALAFIRRERAHPFFLYLAYTIPHANSGLRERGMQVPDDAPYSNEPWPQPEKNKAAMITRLDGDIGRLFALLSELGIDEDTLVFLSSDNGPHMEGGVNPDFHRSSGQLRGIKRDLYEGGIRVPMIVRWPGKIKGGLVSRHVWALWDVLPTLAAIAGKAAPRRIDGVSVLPALLGKKQRTHHYLYWEFHERGFAQALRMGRWKIVRSNSNKPIELYDLENDERETRDLSALHRNRVRRMERLMANVRTESEVWPVKRN